jgi:protein-S-isoprenylcysteine O-methyltransferase Ste14
MSLYYVYATGLVFYCLIHSLLADFKILKKLYYLWWYRLFYVISSSLLLIPLIFLYFKLPSENFFYPGFPYVIALYLLSFLGIIVGYFAAKSYDNDTFLGLKQVRDYFKNKRRYFNENSNLITDKGILGIVRHPYYLASLLILWGRPLYLKDFITNVIFTLYFILGSINEERKLLKIYGEKYIIYKKNVPMIIPFLKRKR